MSAYVVEDCTINAMVGFFAAGRWNNCTEQDAQAMAQTLINENYRSVNFRYSDEGESHKTDYHEQWAFCADHFSAVQILKLCDCYEYQACETDDYRESEAAKIIEKIRKHAISKLPGYGDSEWGLDDSSSVVQKIRKSNIVNLSSLV